MARLKKFSASFSTPSGGRFYLEGDINVDAQGNFYFKFKPEHHTFFHTFVEHDNQTDNETIWIYGRDRNNLYCKKLDRLESVLNKLTNIIAQTGTKEELIIVYKITNQVTYFKFGDGVIAQNADREDYVDHDMKGKWMGSEPDNRSHPNFAVQVYARVMIKVTQSGTDDVKYKNIAHGDILDINEDSPEHFYLHQLNSFLLPWAKHTTESNHDHYENNYKELPYTEQRAKFFYEMLLGMCKLADKFSVLENDETLVKLADSGTKLLT